MSPVKKASGSRGAQLSAVGCNPPLWQRLMLVPQLQNDQAKCRQYDQPIIKGARLMGLLLHHAGSGSEFFDHTAVEARESALKHLIAAVPDRLRHECRG
jgi:hypothetical protein